MIFTEASMGIPKQLHCSWHFQSLYILSSQIISFFHLTLQIPWSHVKKKWITWPHVQIFLIWMCLNITKNQFIVALSVNGKIFYQNFSDNLIIRSNLIFCESFWLDPRGWHHSLIYFHWYSRKKQRTFSTF